MSHHALTRLLRANALRSTARRLGPGAASLALLLGAGCGDSQEPSDTATLSGTVRSAVSSTPLADATVSFGARQATSDVDGRFTLSDVPVGAAMIRAERAGYLPAEAAVTVTAGANSQDFALSPREIYESGGMAVFIPAGVGTLRGAIVIIGGPDASGFVTGERLTPSTSSPELEASLQNLGAGLRAFAGEAGMAILGSGTIGMANSAASDIELFEALNDAAGSSGHPELANVPFVAFGLSAGGPEASGLVSRNSARAIGLLARVPTSVPGGALNVPTFIMQAALDQVVSNSSVRTKFAEIRSRGGLWSLAVEPGVGHSVASVRGNAAAVSWIRRAVELRLTATPGAPLIALDETSGWLGNPTSLDIAPWADYPDNRAEASWLLSEAVAASWKALGNAGGGE